MDIKYPVAYRCECGDLYSEGLYNGLIKNRVKKFEKCGCGIEIKPENNTLGSSVKVEIGIDLASTKDITVYHHPGSYIKGRVE